MRPFQAEISPDGFDSAKHISKTRLWMLQNSFFVAASRRRRIAETQDGPLHLDWCKVIDVGVKCSGRQPGDNGVNGVKKRRHGR